MSIPVFFSPIVPLFPCICWSVVAHTLYHVFLCTALLPVLGMLILCDLWSHQIVAKACICYQSLCLIFLLRNIFVCLVLPLFHFQFLLLSLPLIVRGTCLLQDKLSIFSSNELPMHCYVFPFFFRDSPNLALVCCIPSYFAPPFSFGWLNSSLIFAAVLIIDFIFGWVLSWLLTIFTNWSSL